MTKPYGNPKKARVLVVGHDPRLQTSDTIAPFALFADYYFQPSLRTAPARSKYGLSESVFRMILYLTAGLVAPTEVLLTNLCNRRLPHAPPGKTFLISQRMARQGVKDIIGLLKGSNVKVILAMSQQVNYWLQELGFCNSNTEFLKESEPVRRGVTHKPPYFAPRRPRAFLRVCGHRFHTQAGQSLFPVLHAKQWPLKSRMKAYAANYERARIAVVKDLA